MADTHTRPIRVVLADDHVVVRKGIREFLEEEGDIIVVAEAADGAQAVSLVVEHRPDVAVLDVQMPEMGGIEATRQIKAQCPEVQVLILTAYDDDPYIFALLQAGASGYILKTADSAELVRALRVVYRGESALDSAVAHKVVQRLTGGRPIVAQLEGSVAQPHPKIPGAQRAEGPAGVETLTLREVDVLRLAARGLTNKAIGHTLGISDRTVQGHLANIFGKLGVNSRTEAVTQALKLGWIVVE
jgi:two-component system, NarL family, response regulator LiaR